MGISLRQLLIFSAAFFVSRSFAQSGGVVPLEDYIALLKKRYDVVFSYDSDLLRGVPVRVPAREKNLRASLGYLSEHTVFDFKSNKGNVAVIPKYAGKNFALCGSVYDLRTKEPLFGAVVIRRRSGEDVSTKDNGSFFLPIRYGNGDSVIVSYSGYRRKTLALTDFIAGCRTVYLESEQTELAEVVVTAYLTEGISYDALDNSISLRPKNQTILPGQNNGDVLHSLDALPGISTPDSKAGNLNVRGSTSDQTLISFDEIPVYLKGHFFGTLSPFSSALVDRINVQRSVMSADKGGRVGGAINIVSPSAVVNRLHGTVTSSALDASAFLQVPIVRDKLSFSVSGRKSYPYSVKTPTYGAISDFIFQESEVQALLDGKSHDGGRIEELSYQYEELSAKLTARLSEKHRATVSALYIRNHLLLDRSSEMQQFFQADRIGLKNTGLSATLQSSWTKKWSTSLIMTGSRYDQDATTDKRQVPSNDTLESSLFRNTLTDFRLQAEAAVQLRPSLEFKTGYGLHYHDVGYTRRSTDTSNTSFVQDLYTNGIIHSVYANLSGSWKRLSFNAGLRSNYFDLTRKVNAEPRLILSYKFTETFRVKTSGGYQQQFLTQVSGVSIESIGGLETQLWLLAGERGLPVVSGYQFTAGAIRQKGSWLIDIEGYYKHVSDITCISLTAPLSADPYIYGNIQTVGADVLVRKQWKQLDAWVSYTLSRSLMQFDSISSGETFPSLYDQPHVLDLALSYRVGQWKFSAAWKLRSGLAKLPAIRGRMLHGSPNGGQPSGPVVIPATLTVERFSAYHQLDASVSYHFPKKERGWDGSAGLSAMNCYNQRNVIEEWVVPAPQGKITRYRTMLEFTPNIFVRFSF